MTGCYRKLTCFPTRTVLCSVRIYGGVPVSTGMRKRDQRAVAPGHLKTGTFIN